MRLEVIDDIGERHVDRHYYLSQGKAIAFFCMDRYALKPVLRMEYPEADIYYTERNGEGIGLLVPKKTKHDRLPNLVCGGSMIYKWVDPDDDSIEIWVRDKKRKE